MQFSLKITLVQGFCPLKIKITQFPGGFRLNPLSSNINMCNLLTIFHIYILMIMLEKVLFQTSGHFISANDFILSLDLSIDMTVILLGEIWYWSLWGVPGESCCTLWHSSPANAERFWLQLINEKLITTKNIFYKHDYHYLIKCKRKEILLEWLRSRWLHSPAVILWSPLHHVLLLNVKL